MTNINSIKQSLYKFFQCSVDEIKELKLNKKAGGNKASLDLLCQESITENYGVPFKQKYVFFFYLQLIKLRVALPLFIFFYLIANL